MKQNCKLQASSKTFTKRTLYYWQKYLENQNNLGHAERNLPHNSFLSYINDCLNSSFETILRIIEDTRNFRPHYILEIGSSSGTICLQAKNLYPEAIVLGIEPEKEAIYVSKNMSKNFKLKNLFFVNGVAEKLPFKDEQFDLIICHTVIEHVKNVELTLSEMKRVLNYKGFIHLEAPNYNWPYEPHLSVWCIPRFGKRFVELLSRLQKKDPNIKFLDHIQFVHPHRIENKLNKLSMEWENLFLKKLVNITSGNNSSVKKYIKLSKFLVILKKIKLSTVLIKLITIFKFYPSLMYLIYKNKTGKNYN